MTIDILVGDCRDVLKTLPDQSVHCCVTSPPYFGLRDYGVAGQMGLEPTPDDFVAALVQVFREVRRVLRNDGTVWLNLGDSYAGSWGNQGRKEERGTQRPVNGPMMQNLKPYPDKKTNTGKIQEGVGLKPKDLIGIPWRVAFALQGDGWYLRSNIIWHKPNPMPESVTDRPTSAHESIFLLAKSQRYFYDAEAVKTEDCGHGSGNGFARVDTKEAPIRLSYGGRGQEEQWVPGKGANLRNVWTVPTRAYRDAHFATFPPDLIEPCIKAGCPAGGTVLDPFGGAGTTGLVADRLQRNAVLIELNPAYIDIARNRIHADAPLLGAIA